MITNTVGDNKELQEELVVSIVSYDMNEALKWANRFDLPLDRRPYCIRNMTEDSQTQQK